MKRPSWVTGFGGLLLALCLLFLAQPFVIYYELSGALFELAFSFVLVAGALASSQQPKERMVLGVMVAIAIPVRWIGILSEHTLTIELGQMAALATLWYCAFLILRQVLRSKDVTVDTLYGAAAVYLLAAVCWSTAYQLVANNIEGAFRVDGAPFSGDNASGAGIFAYYSLVTLTTLGYGDITALNPIARTLSALEAAFGQLYVALLIGRLLGLHLQGKPA